MIVEYRSGQAAPIVRGHRSKHPQNWECVLDCHYADRIERVEFSAAKCHPADLQPVITAESRKLFAQYGEPIFVKFRAESK